jgi:hypothetical protein
MRTEIISIIGDRAISKSRDATTSATRFNRPPTGACLGKLGARVSRQEVV